VNYTQPTPFVDRFALASLWLYRRFIVEGNAINLDLTSSLFYKSPNAIFEKVLSRLCQSPVATRQLSSVLVHARHLIRLTRANPVLRIAHFTNLRHLKFFYCDALTDREFRPVSALTLLTTLEIPGSARIDENALFETLKGHTLLETLDISLTAASLEPTARLCSWLQTLTKLTYLGFDGNGEMDLRAFNMLATQLTGLSLRRWRARSDEGPLFAVRNLVQIATFTKLRCLSLANNISGLLDGFVAFYYQ